MSTLFAISISKHFYVHVVPIVCEFFRTIPDRFQNFPLRYLSVVLGLAYLAIILFSYRRFQPLKERYKGLRMHYKLLNALVEDVNHVSKMGKEIDEKAHQHWDSQLRPGGTVQLSADGRAWVTELKEVVRNAESCHNDYDRLCERRQFLKLLYSSLMDFRKIGDFRATMNGARDRIHGLYRKSYDQIYESLERSRSNVRSLQDRPIILEKKPCPYNPDVRLQSTQSIEVKLKGAIHGKLQELDRDRKEDIQYNIEFPLKLLLAFLEDLRGLRMESQTEKAWVENAEDLILELQHDMDHILKTANRMRWLFYLGNWIARGQIKKWYYCYRGLLSFLIYGKNYRYTFKFVRRDSSKSVNDSRKKKQTRTFSSQATTNDDTGISSRLSGFGKKLEQEQGMDEFKQLLDNFKRLQGSIKETKGVEGTEHSRKAWTDQLSTIFQDAEKSFNAYRESKPSDWSENPNKTDFRSKLKPEVDRFHNALYFLQTCISVFRIEVRKENNWVVGLEKDIHNVVSELITNSENGSTYFIVGMKGIGKTTLATMVYYHGEIQKHFKFRYWVPVDDIVDEDKNVLPEKLRKYIMDPPATKKEGKEKEEGTNKKGKEKDYKRDEVKHFLKDKKYLVVLDNISSVGAWGSVKAAFPDSTNGSRIVVTTRVKSVASHAGQNSRDLYKLPLRTKDESMKLFEQMVNLPSEPSNERELFPKDVRSLANEVVGRCGGLPHSILRVGYLLSGGQVTSEEFSRVLEIMDHNETSWSETLPSNDENDFPQDLVKCLSYFGLFPRGSQIPARRLVALWVAEELAVAQQIGDEKKPPEFIAKKYLDDLISLNLVQVVERKPNGKTKTCGFPSALREQWLRLDPNSSLDRCLVYHFDENDKIGTQSLLRSCRNPRSILFFDTREGIKPGEDIGQFLRMGIASGHLLQLKVLDLEFVFRPRLPNAIKKLIHLTYLGLRWTYLEKIPASIGNLTNLQTLDVKHTYIRELPSSIWKLQNLQHLYINQIYRSRILDQPSENSLKNLQTLQGAFVDKDSPLKYGLRRFTNLRKLALAFQLNLSQQTTLAESLLQLKQLQNLKLKSIDEMGRPKDLKATFLSKFDNLSNLFLFGKFETISINGLPGSLTDLTLSASGLSEDPMQELGKLLKLKSLSLYSGSYTGKKMSCSKEGFPELQVLNFWMLRELEEWKVEEHSMPKLKQLEIRSCKSLKVLTGLRNLKALGKLRLKDMPVEVTEKIEQTNERSDIAHFPFVIID
ncbi:probable disease resistance protein At1g58602 [Quercus lobata]|uniref:NB-ARC domain-containing protein n=1 Tax=Quercus lobata TaxID=97700 RepID=A0A7N2LMM2_QUELO|nr:probable disease resistance protein At1g58602 [Quercus lobata]